MTSNNDKSKNPQSKLPKFGDKKSLPSLIQKLGQNILASFAKVIQGKTKSDNPLFKPQANVTKEFSKKPFKKRPGKKTLPGNKSLPKFVNKNWRKRETPEQKKERLFNKWAKYDIGKLKLNITRRFQNKYKFLNSKDHLVFNLIIKPNNVFSIISGVTIIKDPKTGKLTPQVSKIKAANSSTYKIKFSKRGIKGKVLNYLRSFLKDFKFLKVKRFRFAVLNIACPKFLRKHILSSISKFFLSKKFLNKEVIVQIRDMKVFNGCVARKQRRKKRKKFVLYK